jgi:hypothetical protein
MLLCEEGMQKFMNVWQVQVHALAALQLEGTEDSTDKTATYVHPSHTCSWCIICDAHIIMLCAFPIDCELSYVDVHTTQKLGLVFFV